MTAKPGRPFFLCDAPAPASAATKRARDPARQPARLSVAKAAARAGVCSRTVKRWIAARRLAATRLPSPGGRGHLRIRIGDLEVLLAQGSLD